MLPCLEDLSRIAGACPAQSGSKRWVVLGLK